MSLSYCIGTVARIARQWPEVYFIDSMTLWQQDSALISQMANLAEYQNATILY